MVPADHGDVVGSEERGGGIGVARPVDDVGHARHQVELLGLEVRERRRGRRRMSPWVVVTDLRRIDHTAEPF
ncbi:MAG TPA: hypothetical protein VFI18_06620 [Gaiellales bacterium]|nr:hypothetical protein [Gaiellales bacterium]